MPEAPKFGDFEGVGLVRGRFGDCNLDVVGGLLLMPAGEKDSDDHCHKYNVLGQMAAKARSCEKSSIAPATKGIAIVSNRSGADGFGHI